MAVAGDVVVAVLLALGVMGPTRLALRRATWSLERRGWARLVARSVERPPRFVDRLLRLYLVRSLRIWIRFHQMRDSLPFAAERALQMGLPLVAVVVATVPIWGMSWYFNSENWAAGHLQLLGRAAHRHLARRDDCVRCSRTTQRGDRRAAFAVGPPGSAAETSRSW